ncbi:MAG: DUF2254 family protein, partial [Ilumatobacteraceae bacterium]
LYPDEVGRDPADADGAATSRGVPADLVELAEGCAVEAHGTGYVLGIDDDALMALATTHDLVISLQVRPGDHVIDATVLASLWPPDRSADDLQDRARSAVRVGHARTPQEDVEFPVRLLEEMAVRALSPGTNDPYTAVNALDDLTAGLARLAGRRTPSQYRYDEHGHLRLVATRIELSDLLDRVLDAMRLYAIDHPMVLHRTLALVDVVGAASADRSVKARLDRHVRQLVEAFAHSSPQECDADALRRHADEVRRALADGQVRRAMTRYSGDSAVGGSSP